MTPIQYALRLLFVIMQQPSVQKALSTTARRVAAETTKTLIREISNGVTRFEQRKTTPKVK